MGLEVTCVHIYTGLTEPGEPPEDDLMMYYIFSCYESTPNIQEKNTTREFHEPCIINPYHIYITFISHLYHIYIKVRWLFFCLRMSKVHAKRKTYQRDRDRAKLLVALFYNCQNIPA